MGFSSCRSGIGLIVIQSSWLSSSGIFFGFFSSISHLVSVLSLFSHLGCLRRVSSLTCLGYLVSSSRLRFFGRSVGRSSGTDHGRSDGDALGGNRPSA